MRGFYASQKKKGVMQENEEQKPSFGEPVSLEQLVQLAGRHRRTAQKKTEYYPETVYYIPHHKDKDGNICPYLDEKGEPVTHWIPYVLAGQPVSPQQAKRAKELYLMFKPENDKIRKKMEVDYLRKNKLRELPYPGCPWRVERIIPLKVEQLLNQ